MKSCWPRRASGRSGSSSSTTACSLLLDKDWHKVIAEGASAEPLDTSMFHLQGRTDLGEE